jgi:hypothetical protein
MGRKQRKGEEQIFWMRWILQNSSGREVGTGWTFLSTFLYFRTRMVGSAGGSGGKGHGSGSFSGMGGVDEMT